MQCMERTRLVTIYRQRVQDYSNAMATLATGPSLCHDDFMKRWECAEFARDACTLARINVWGHVADHGCLIDGDPLADRRAA